MTARLSRLYPFIDSNGVVIEKKNIFVNMNSKNSILLVDPDFDVNSAINCDLLIKITADNFSYAIIDEAENRLVLLYDQQECPNVKDALAHQLNNDEHLAIAFQSVKTSVQTPNAITIPNEFYDVANLNSYAQFFSVEQSKQLHSQHLAGRDFTSIFNLDQSIEELLTSKFEEPKLYDHTAPLLTLAADSNDKTLMMDFTVGSVNVVLTDGNKLIFQNCYETDDAGEFTYYLLLMIHQLEIDTAFTKVLVSGIIHEDDKKYAAIKQYFTEISFNGHKAKRLGGDILEDMPNQYYSTLLALQLCE